MSAILVQNVHACMLPVGSYVDLRRCNGYPRVLVTPSARLVAAAFDCRAFNADTDVVVEVNGVKYFSKTTSDQSMELGLIGSETSIVISPADYRPKVVLEKR